MTEETILVPKTITSCDLCGNKRGGFIECSVCGRTVCRTCRSWNQCKDCWDKNEYYAEVRVHEKDDSAYNGWNDTKLRLVPDSTRKVHSLYEKFAGKYVKITIQVAKTKEELKNEKCQKQLTGDDPQGWLE